MSVLCIDAGNTRVKWGVRERDGWRDCGAGTIVELAGLTLSAHSIVASNVGGTPARQAIEALAARLRVPLHWLHATAAQCGVANGYDVPEQLGADRWAALIGARAVHRGACLVVMCGTATTVDLLAADGRFEGGLILPGIDLMRSALAGGTANLPAVAGRFAEKPRNTVDAIASGVIQATAGAIERMAGQLARTDQPLCLLSGGAAGVVSPRLTFIHRVVDNLVLDGLAVVADELNLTGRVGT